MPPVKHALLGASSAHRWLACPPSARWEQQFPDNPTGTAAAEGTLAHAIAEEHLTRLIQHKRVATSAKLKKDELYRPVMEEHVALHTDYIMEKYNESKRRTPDTLLLTEQRVDYSDWVPEGFGTADCIMIADGQIDIFDFKYGKGVPVSAVGNPQLRLYALGALNIFDQLYALDSVTVHIIQPRLDSITSESMTVEALKDWAEREVRPRAELAVQGEGDFTPGEHCRFCKAKYVCRAYAQAQLDIAKTAFSEAGDIRPAQELSPAEISDILTRVDELTRWAKGIKDWALDQSVNHSVTYPGYKVVEGRSNRVISNKERALELLDQAGFTPDTVTDLKSLGALEDIVGKKKLADLLGDVIIKPSGKPVLAKEDDKRPALSSFTEAQRVFTPIED